VIVARVRRTIRERGLISAGDRVLVACSGGPDSAALLWCLATLASELGFTLTAASIDHGLRPGAYADVETARVQAGSLNVELRSERLTLPAGGNVQARARTARYRALHRIAHEVRATRIAVGHTMDDQAETVLMRLLRGSSLRAVSGISPRRRDGVIRPLIDCRRSAVHQLAGLRFANAAQDPSNHDPRFERVRVRLDLLPALAAENVAVVEHLAGLADDARATTALVRRQAVRLLRSSQQSLSDLSVGHIRDAESAVRREALRIWLRRATGVRAGRSHLLQLELAVLGRGEVWLPDGWVVRPDGGGVLRARRGAANT
jgi:tRNA(Ile)-lysidine synthase